VIIPADDHAHMLGIGVEVVLNVSLAAPRLQGYLAVDRGSSRGDALYRSSRGDALYMFIFRYLMVGKCEYIMGVPKSDLKE
jgi:hypothetical protein